MAQFSMLNCHPSRTGQTPPSLFHFAIHLDERGVFILPPSSTRKTRRAMITQDVLEQHNLSESEYNRIVSILKREPTLTELGIFSVMWSEHCSYKSSRVHLKRLPTRGPQVIQGPGENAGVVDLGDGYCAVFKMESHNHPSYIEPYQGAATGVGGIMRDVFTM